MITTPNIKHPLAFRANKPNRLATSTSDEKKARTQAMHCLARPGNWARAGYNWENKKTKMRLTLGCACMIALRLER